MCLKTKSTQTRSACSTSGNSTLLFLTFRRFSGLRGAVCLLGLICRQTFSLSLFPSPAKREKISGQRCSLRTKGQHGLFVNATQVLTTNPRAFHLRPLSGSVLIFLSCSFKPTPWIRRCRLDRMSFQTPVVQCLLSSSHIALKICPGACVKPTDASL